MSKTSQAEPDQEQWTLDEATNKEQQRRAALQGGARYRQTARDRSESTASVDTECKGCGNHVSRRYARVMGLEGTVFACPECSDTAENLNGATAGRLRRETL